MEAARQPGASPFVKREKRTTDMPAPKQSTALHDLTAMASAFAVAMGRDFNGDADSRLARPSGSWFIERADGPKPLYRLAERSAYGGVSYPLGALPLTARGLSDALYVARIAIGMERTHGPASALGWPYRGDAVSVAERQPASSQTERPAGGQPELRRSRR